MKTIAEFVRNGIKDPDELRQALQTAVRLEFSTIPPYLCAEWSIDRSTDPSRVRSMIGDIVQQEMFHLAAAGNILSAIGGVPQLASREFVPTYPTDELPGEIALPTNLDLCPLSAEQVAVFMNIEYPEFPPVAFVKDKPATIGDFYTAIATAIVRINPPITAGANAIEYGQAKRIGSIDDALNAIAEIKAQGEGTEGNPDQPLPMDTVPAHYYQFKEIQSGFALVHDDSGWHFSGDAIQLPKAFPFPLKNVDPDASLEFNRMLSQVLIDLENCWTKGVELDTASMGKLRTLGTRLIKSQIRPEFVWANPIAS